MTRKIILIIFAIFFFKISMCFARFNAPHVLRRTFSDFDLSKNITQVKVLNKPTPPNSEIIVSINNYMKGVVYKELIGWAEDTTNNNKYVQGFAAQAVAARTYLANKIVNKDSRITTVDDSTVQVPNGQGFQVYEYSEDYPEAIDSALVLAGGTILAYYDGDGKTLIPIDALYGGQFEEPFTRDSENCGLNYQPYLRSVENYEKISGGTPTSQKCGMSQIGALSYARENINFETILDHYYGPTPPAVVCINLIVAVDSTGTLIHAYQNNTAAETGTTREMAILVDHYLCRLEKNLAIEIGFDEVIGSDFEAAVSANAVQAWLIGDNISKEFTTKKKFIRFGNLNTPIKNFWTAEIPKENLTDLDDGTYSVKVSASHFQAGYLLDSTIGDKAYKENFKVDHSQYTQGTGTSCRLKVDVHPPEITFLYPASSNAIITVPYPNFRAFVRDAFSGVDTASVKITLNGQEFNYANGMTYNSFSGELKFTPQFPLKSGYYEWHVICNDNAK